MNIPPDDPTVLDPNLSLTKKGGKGPLVAVVAVVVLAVGAFGYQSMRKRDERKLHAAFIQSFADVEKGDVAKFWECILGPKVDVGAFPDNLALSQRITSQFGIDAKNYPAHVREECTPKAIDAKHKLEGMRAPSDYAEPLKKYEQGLQDLATSFDAWTKVAPAQVQEMEVGRKVGTFGAAWHAFGGGKPGNDVIAYDRFLHCAVPTVDSMKDGQAVVEYLFNQCKQPAYVTRVQDECGKELLADPPGSPTKNWQTALRKQQGDDRELSAFDDCLRKGRKGKRRDDLEAVGRAWVSFMEAGREVRKIGKEALKDE
jgi:hypothetical protein